MDLFSEPGSPWDPQVCFRWLLLVVLEYIAVASEVVFPMRRTFPTVFALVGMIVVNCLFDCLGISLFTTQLRLSAKVSCFLYFWSNDGDQCLVKMVVSSEGEWLWRPTQFAWFEHRWISRTSFTLPIAKLKAQCIIPRGFQWISLFFLSVWSEYNYYFVIMLFWTWLLFSLYWLVFLFLICSCSLSYITLPAHKCLII